MTHPRRLRPRGPQEHDLRRQQGRLSPAQCHPGQGFPARVRRHPAGCGGRHQRRHAAIRSRSTRPSRSATSSSSGYKYSESMGLRVLDPDGKEVTPIMGSYGIGIERILTCAIELYNDADGMSLPPSIAPFAVVITPGELEGRSAARRRRDVVRRMQAARPRCAARRPRRAPGREIQGRRPDRHSLAHHRRQEARAGHGRGGRPPHTPDGGCRCSAKPPDM